MRFNTIVSALCLFVLTGCGGQKLPEGIPKLTPAVLTITQDGAPLEGAVVSLIPMDPGNSRWNAGGVTGKDGKAKIRTHAQYDGVAAGKYRVTVVKTFVEPLPPGLTEAQRRSYKGPPPVEYVNKKYADRLKTPLEVEVGDSPLSESFEVEKP